jgi:hypothetical protein
MSDIKSFLKGFNIFSHLFYSEKEIERIINRTDVEAFYEDAEKIRSDWKIIFGEF